MRISRKATVPGRNRCGRFCFAAADLTAEDFVDTDRRCPDDVDFDILVVRAMADAGWRSVGSVRGVRDRGLFEVFFEEMKKKKLTIN